MSFGDVIFRVPDLAYQRLKRAFSYRWAEHPIADGSMAYQFTGKGPETLSISGYTLPDLPGYTDILATGRATGEAGEPRVMVDMNGDIYGLWILREITEDRSVIRKDNWPGRIDFTMELSRYEQ